MPFFTARPSVCTPRTSAGLYYTLGARATVCQHSLALLVLFRTPGLLGGIAAALSTALLLAQELLGKEVHEEHEQGHDVGNVHQCDIPGVRAPIVEDEHPLPHHHHKLNQLGEGHQDLPGRSRAVHGDTVVEVHHHVHKAVKNHREIDIPVVSHGGIHPVNKEDGDVVVNVEERQLVPFLAQHNEHSVEEIKSLGHVKQPQKAGHPGLGRVKGVAHEGVPILPRFSASSHRHVRAKDDLGYIVQANDAGVLEELERG